MPYERDTATDHNDLFQRLRTFLTDSGGGAGWEELRYNSTDKRALFVAPGISDDQEIHMGLSVHADVGLDAYAIGLWMFKAYVDALGDLEQPGHSGVVYHTVWNTAIPYLLIANGQRMILRSKISTTYSAAYMGKFFPYGTPSEYNKPFYVGGNVAAATTRWSSTSENNRNFFDPGEAGLVLRPDLQWYPCSNFLEVSGGQEQEQSDSNFIWPYAGSITQANTKTRFREQRENLDATYPLRPLIIHGDNPLPEMLGELDGAFVVSGFNNASENIIQSGGVDHEVVQNVFRTARYYYAALKLE